MRNLKRRMEKNFNTIRLAGVPEHFNFPWLSWLQAHQYRAFGKEWKWQDFPGGSGAMLAALLEDQTDLALVLTESAANAIIQGIDIQPLAVYVASPLVWGIFSGAGNPLRQVSPVRGKKYAISRFGSGSHLVARLDAGLRGESLEENQFLPVQNLEGARLALEKQEADLFFWEKWMTKPLCDQGILKMVDERPAPWAAFVLICKPAFWKNENNRESVTKAFGEVLEIAGNLKVDSQAPGKIAKAYHLNESDAATWLSGTRWPDKWENPEIDIKIAAEALQALR